MYPLASSNIIPVISEIAGITFPPGSELNVEYVNNKKVTEFVRKYKKFARHSKNIYIYLERTEISVYSKALIFIFLCVCQAIAWPFFVHFYIPVILARSRLH